MPRKPVGTLAGCISQLTEPETATLYALIISEVHQTRRLDTKLYVFKIPLPFYYFFKATVTQYESIREIRKNATVTVTKNDCNSERIKTVTVTVTAS